MGERCRNESFSDVLRTFYALMVLGVLVRALGAGTHGSQGTLGRSMPSLFPPMFTCPYSRALQDRAVCHCQHKQVARPTTRPEGSGCRL
ncbi:hypothetical protein C8Q73DRAFT_680031 [Cubamyces lactineus]|nr:hypothetical protein C8Q73DRAFT_680031 [Cubamyces lactineus]